MKLKPVLLRCANAAEVQTEVRRISENAVTHPPVNEKLRVAFMAGMERTYGRPFKVFQPWTKRRDWQLD